MTPDQAAQRIDAYHMAIKALANRRDYWRNQRSMNVEYSRLDVMDVWAAFSINYPRKDRMLDAAEAALERIELMWLKRWFGIPRA